jgi:hypothetical protein
MNCFFKKQLNDELLFEKAYSALVELKINIAEDSEYYCFVEAEKTVEVVEEEVAEIYDDYIIVIREDYIG